MKRRDNIKRLKSLQFEKGAPKKKAAPKKKKEEPKPDMDLNDDGKVDEKDVEMVKEEAKKTKKKVVKKDD